MMFAIQVGKMMQEQKFCDDDKGYVDDGEEEEGDNDDDDDDYARSKVQRVVLSSSHLQAIRVLQG